MCTGSEAFRASPAPGLSRPVNSSLGRACLAELALPPSRLQPRDVSLLDLNFAGGGWENASGGLEVGLDGSASHLICLSSSRRVQRICMGVMEMNVRDILPAQEDPSRWGHTEVDRWLNYGVTVMEDVSYINCFRPCDMLAQVWGHLSPLPVPSSCQAWELRHQVAAH